MDMLKSQSCILLSVIRRKRLFNEKLNRERLKKLKHVRLITVLASSQFTTVREKFKGECANANAQMAIEVPAIK